MNKDFWPNEGKQYSYQGTILLLKERQQFIKDNMPYANGTLEAYKHVLDDLLGAEDFDGLFSLGEE